MIVCPYCATVNDDNAKVCKTCGASLDAAQYPSALPIGSSLQGGKYRIEKVLGQGGFGVTYKAQNTTLGIPVVVKEYNPSGSTRIGNTVRPPSTLSQQEFMAARARFADEARLVAQLTLTNPNPHIVRVYDVFTENDSEYYSMEFLEGKSLQNMVEKGGPLSEAQVLEIARQLTSALDLVHAAGLLHRDIKPDNIMMVARGAVLIDFGSARSMTTGAGAKQSIIVTPGYAPLEQYASNARRGPFTDIYALAGTLMFALTGKEPVPATDRASGAAQPTVRDQNPKVSKAFSDVIDNAMHMRVDERPQTVEEFTKLLEGAMGKAGNTKVQPAPPRQQPTKPVNTNPGAQIFQTTPSNQPPGANKPVQQSVPNLNPQGVPKPAGARQGGDYLWMLYLVCGAAIVLGQMDILPRSTAVIGFYGAVLLTAYIFLQWLIGTWIGRIVLLLVVAVFAAVYFRVVDFSQLLR